MKQAIVLIAALAGAGSLPLAVHFSPQNDSHEAGTAVLTAANNATRITITINNEPHEAIQPANVHAGNCAFVEQIRYPLTNVRNGHSTTIVPISLHELTSTPNVIVIQDSPASLHAAKDYKYVSCAPITISAQP